MDQTLQTALISLWPVWAVLVIAGLLGAVLRHPRFKGWRGERRVQRMIREGLNPHEYVDLHNVTLPTEGGSTQIDHLIFSPHGVFVLETKNLKGWIFGSERQPEWTQKIHKNHSQKFQNPIRQNYLHTQTVQQKQVHSVVAFVGESQFKTEMPAQVLQGDAFIGYIRQFQQAVWSLEQMQMLIDRLEQVRLAPTRATHQAHVAHVQKIKAIKADKTPKAPRPARSAAAAGSPSAAPAMEVPVASARSPAALPMPSDPMAEPVVVEQLPEAVAATAPLTQPRPAPTPQQVQNAPLLDALAARIPAALAAEQDTVHTAAPPSKPATTCPQCQSPLRRMRLQRGPLAGRVIYRCSNTALCQYVQPPPDRAPLQANV